jgi:hypothetical protein
VTRPARIVLAALAAQALVVVAVSCGVPTGDSTFDEIDGEVLAGLNDTTTTTTSTTTTTTTTIVPDTTDPSLDTTTVVPVTEPPPAATVAVYFISRGSLSAQTFEVDPQWGLNDLVDLLEQGPPDDGVGARRQSFVEPGLIVGTPIPDAGVILVELDGDVFGEISRNNQRQAFAQIVVTLLQRSEVGQVSFTIDGEIVPVPVESGSKDAASVSDFLGAPPSSADPSNEVDTGGAKITSGPNTTLAQ